MKSCQNDWTLVCSAKDPGPFFSCQYWALLLEASSEGWRETVRYLATGIDQCLERDSYLSARTAESCSDGAGHGGAWSLFVSWLWSGERDADFRRAMRTKRDVDRLEAKRSKIPGVGDASLETRDESKEMISVASELQTGGRKRLSRREGATSE